MADRYLTLSNGRLRIREATDQSAGAANAGDIAALDSSGKIHSSMLPSSVGDQTVMIQASEALSAGNFVNVWDDGGTPKIRKADNSNDRPAHGFVLASVAEDAMGAVHFRGVNTSAPSGTPGFRVYLGTSGGILSSALDETSSANANKLHQRLGTYIASTSIEFKPQDEVVL